MRTSKNLDVKSIEALKPREAPYRVSDGGGLLIEVRPTGARAWLCRLTVNGKRRDMGLGGYPLVSLAAARAAATEARRLARDGVDPIGQREAIAASRLAELAARSEAEARAFRRVADVCIKSQAPGWKNKRTADLWLNSLEKYAFPDLGDMPVGDIGPKDVLRAVGTVWATRPATAKKVLRRIGTALRFAAAHGWRANDNPTDVRMLRHAGLPALQGGRKQPSLPWPKAPAFIKALGLVDGIAPLALHFCILTTVRSGEVRGARWSEMSFDDGMTWAIAGERMKGKKSADVQPHRIPLSPAAVSVLLRAYTLVTGTAATKETLPRLATLQRDALIFPTPSKSKTPLSDAALSAVMLRMNADRPDGVAAPWCDPDGRKAVPHGWRATFRTWVDDTRPEDTVAAERALAHEDSNKVSGAYRRSDLFDRRKPLMKAWAAHCEGTAKGRGVKGNERVRKLTARD